jgi:hypothetical protein
LEPVVDPETMLEVSRKVVLALGLEKCMDDALDSPSPKFLGALTIIH